ncbi:MAG TPA: hypothetical protein VGU66_07630 [Candidatus Elarobacter sp.]|nr:hypothetical protein [Candidatus Elarobacter sp.]
MIRRVGATLLALTMTATLVVAVREPARAAALCGTPGRDGSPGNLTGIVNTYWPGTANAGAGATSITVGAHAAGDASTAIASGDLLLVVQMQAATLNTTNTSSYGDGSGSGSGAISTTAGTFEYVVAAGALAVGGGSVTITGTNGGGLIHAYTTGGNAHFQVIRVPQYTAPTVGGALVPLAWNGTAGGVLAIDVANILNGNGSTIVADAKGFRGGQGRALAGDATAANGDWVNLDTKNAHGIKGEGTAGTPGLVYANGTGSTVADTYPAAGDTGRGAPGNAGGGGADANVAANDQNTGGGGGGNGGAGGGGGKSWSSNLAYGGRGGVFTPSATQVVLGGGGGAGARNNGSGFDSSGGTGGGMVMIRVAGVTGGMTITANGGMGVDPQNDGGGGGGAGGSVMMTGLATLTGVTVTANGANGTDADVLNGGGADHGPGGGGGGGVAVSNGGITTNLNGGAAGVTDGALLPDAHYGATAGASGQNLAITYASVSGASSGAECASSPVNGILIGPVGVPNATGSYDGNVATTNNDDFVEKSFTPAAFNAINSSTTPGSPNGNTYPSAVSGIAVRHQVHNYGGASNFIFYAQAPTSGGSWTMTVNADSAGALGAVIAGTASGNVYQTTTTVGIAANADYFVWTVYSAPSGLQAFNRFDATIAVIDIANVGNNNTVHDELYTGFIVQTKSYVITTTGCSGGVPAGTWCPGGTLKYTIDVRNVALAANGTTPASATLSANSLTLTDDGSNPNSWAKDGGYLNTPGYSSTGTAPTTVTYYYNLTNNTVFPANYNTTNKVFKVTSTWAALAAGANSQFMFTAVQF